MKGKVTKVSSVNVSKTAQRLWRLSDEPSQGKERHVDQQALAKRRAKNRRARKSRRANR